MDDGPTPTAPRLAFATTLVVTYAVAMALLAAFAGLTWSTAPFLVLNAVVVVNVAYIAACTVTSVFSVPRIDEPDLDDPPRVAVLYCTYNDADPDAIRAACDQTYDRADAFVLDDSTDPTVRDRVDRAADRGGATVVRRDDRSGYKAGALNHWLDRSGDDYDHLVVLDADSVVPSDWVERMVKKMAARPDLAMLHSRSESHRERTRFSRMLRGGISTYMETVARAETLMGPMLSWGHHVVVRVEAIEAVGGFVEARAEDLATSMKLMRAGWGSAYAPDVVAYETSPPTYGAVRTRNIRWGEGTLEALAFLRRDVPLGAVLSLVWRASAFLAGPALLALFALVMADLPAPNADLAGVWAGMLAAGMALPIPSAIRTGRWRDVVSYWVGAGLLALGSLVSSTYLVLTGLWDGDGFAVTPKDGGRVPLRASFRTFALEVVAGVAFLVLAVALGARVGFLWGGLLMSVPLFNTWTSVPLDDGDAEASAADAG